jgi:formylmethanofuran dehydrogenase subunit E
VETLADYVGPLVICVRGPSRSGKTALTERLVTRLESDGLRVAYLKRSHHILDLPEKASGRVWERRPAAMVLRAADRLQLTVPPADTSVEGLLAILPHHIDVVLLETHTPEPYPTVLAASASPAAGEVVLGRWAMESIDTTAAEMAAIVRAMVPADAALDSALRAAMRLHGGHACAGLILGTRLALTGLSALGLTPATVHRQLIVVAETDRCAVDAVQAVTGCRPGKRTLRLLDYGKLAATFIDQAQGRSVRVAARGDLRARVGGPVDRHERHEFQRLAYVSMPADEMFSVADGQVQLSQFDQPGPPRTRVTCSACAEEVSDGREVATDAGLFCRPCAIASWRESGHEEGQQ